MKNKLMIGLVSLLCAIAIYLVGTMLTLVFTEDQIIVIGVLWWFCWCVSLVSLDK